MGLPEKPIKGVNLYRQNVLDLWEQAERAARNEHPDKNLSEGQVLGQISAAYIETDSPLKEGEQ